ncbi:hypothetical protein R3P38DRAFT_1356850 [Favolaschia claudopus]|uniref:Uncharacterized protein n=1 Tax=Favolaschia claudopus TaxID=2862362 RepID=A0AAW0DUG1_9AGAR
MYLLSRRWGAPGVGFLMTASFVMAVVATAQIILIVARAVAIFHCVQNQVFTGETLNELQCIAHIEKTFIMIQLTLCLINVSTVDCLFLYRCYAVWNHRRDIIVLPALFITCTLVVGILWAINPENVTKAQVVVCLAMVTNLILTALTAGRIVYLGRLARLKLDLYSDKSRSIDNASKFCTRSKRAIAIILESGAIYCAVMIFLFIMAIKNQVALQIAGSLFEIILNIIPTFTTVYIGLKNQCTNPAEP